MVDAATSFHAALLLRNRNASHVARKFMRHWCSLYGSPEAITHDQGGEFDGAFVGWMESQSKTSGARSPWQHGFCERHSALLGTARTSLIWSYKAEGRDQMKHCREELHSDRQGVHTISAGVWQTSHLTRLAG